MFKKATAALAMIAAMSTLVSAEIFFDTLNKTNLQDEISALELSVSQPATPFPKGPGRLGPAAPCEKSAAGLNYKHGTQ